MKYTYNEQELMYSLLEECRELYSNQVLKAHGDTCGLSHILALAYILDEKEVERHLGSKLISMAHALDDLSGEELASLDLDNFLSYQVYS